VKDTVVNEVIDGLKEAGVKFVSFLPDSWFKKIYFRFLEDPDFITRPVSNEGVGVGLCCGAWLGGMKAVMLMENTGVRMACDQLARLGMGGVERAGAGLLVDRDAPGGSPGLRLRRAVRGDRGGARGRGADREPAPRPSTGRDRARPAGRGVLRSRFRRLRSAGVPARVNGDQAAAARRR